MPTDESKKTTERRTKVEEIPTTEKKLTEEEMKKVKGGVARRYDDESPKETSPRG